MSVSVKLVQEQSKELEQFRVWIGERVDELNKKIQETVFSAECYRGAAQVKVSRCKRDRDTLKLIDEMLVLIERSIVLQQPVKFRISEEGFEILEKICFPRHGT